MSATAPVAGGLPGFAGVGVATATGKAAFILPASLRSVNATAVDFVRFMRVGAAVGARARRQRGARPQSNRIIPELAVNLRRAAGRFLYRTKMTSTAPALPGVRAPYSNYAWIELVIALGEVCPRVAHPSASRAMTACPQLCRPLSKAVTPVFRQTERRPLDASIVPPPFGGGYRM